MSQKLALAYSEENKLIYSGRQAYNSTCKRCKFTPKTHSLNLIDPKNGFSHQSNFKRQR